MITKIGVSYEVGDPYLYAKFYYDLIRVFCSPMPECSNAYKVTRLVFSGSGDASQPSPLHRVLLSVRQMTLFRARMCPFGGPENKVLHFDAIFPKKEILDQF